MALPCSARPCRSSQQSFQELLNGQPLRISPLSEPFRASRVTLVGVLYLTSHTLTINLKSTVACDTCTVTAFCCFWSHLPDPTFRPLLTLSSYHSCRTVATPSVHSEHTTPFNAHIVSHDKPSPPLLLCRPLATRVINELHGFK